MTVKHKSKGFKATSPKTQFGRILIKGKIISFQDTEILSLSHTLVTIDRHYIFLDENVVLPVVFYQETLTTLWKPNAMILHDIVWISKQSSC